jgi:hypothetical protein
MLINKMVSIISMCGGVEGKFTMSRRGKSRQPKQTYCVTKENAYNSVGKPLIQPQKKENAYNQTPSSCSFP